MNNVAKGLKKTAQVVDSAVRCQVPVVDDNRPTHNQVLDVMKSGFLSPNVYLMSGDWVDVRNIQEHVARKYGLSTTHRGVVGVTEDGEVKINFTGLPNNPTVLLSELHGATITVVHLSNHAITIT